MKSLQKSYRSMTTNIDSDFNNLESTIKSCGNTKKWINNKHEDIVDEMQNSSRTLPRIITSRNNKAEERIKKNFNSSRKGSLEHSFNHCIRLDVNNFKPKNLQEKLPRGNNLDFIFRPEPLEASSEWVREYEDNISIYGKSFDEFVENHPRYKELDNSIDKALIKQLLEVEYSELYHNKKKIKNPNNGSLADDSKEKEEESKGNEIIFNQEEMNKEHLIVSKEASNSKESLENKSSDLLKNGTKKDVSSKEHHEESELSSIPISIESISEKSANSTDQNNRNQNSSPLEENKNTNVRILDSNIKTERASDQKSTQITGSQINPQPNEIHRNLDAIPEINSELSNSNSMISARNYKVNKSVDVEEVNTSINNIVNSARISSQNFSKHNQMLKAQTASKLLSKNDMINDQNKLIKVL